MNKKLAPCAPMTESICAACPLCGGPNECKPALTGSHEGEPCWCTTVHFNQSLLDRVPLFLQGKSCICKACATKANADDSSHLLSSADSKFG